MSAEDRANRAIAAELEVPGVPPCATCILEALYSEGLVVVAQEDVLSFYRPLVQASGNYSADIAGSACNALLRALMVKWFGLREDEVEAHFKRLDDEAWERSETIIRRLSGADQDS